jgi:hypothetical protein
MEASPVSTIKQQSPWWHRIVMFLAYLGPLSVLIMTVGELRTRSDFAPIERAGKRGIVLFLAQVAIFLVCSVCLDNAYWQVDTGIFPSIWVAAGVCGIFSLIYGVAALIGSDLHFPEPFETWAVNLKI